MIALNLLLASLAAAWYVAACIRSPFPRCVRCNGAGFNKYTITECPRCHGTGHRLRTGRHVYNYLARTYRDANPNRSNSRTDRSGTRTERRSWRRDGK
jgi:hypothetical protein